MLRTVLKVGESTKALFTSVTLIGIGISVTMMLICTCQKLSDTTANGFPMDYAGNRVICPKCGQWGLHRQGHWYKCDNGHWFDARLDRLHRVDKPLPESWGKDFPDKD